METLQSTGSYSNYSWQTPKESSGSLTRVLGDELRKERLRSGLTQEEVAAKAHISRNYVSLLELNEKSPTVQILVRVCKVLGVKPSTILARIEK